jgi:hypothetical protein
MGHRGFSHLIFLGQTSVLSEVKRSQSLSHNPFHEGFFLIIYLNYIKLLFLVFPLLLMTRILLGGGNMLN